MLLLFNAIHLLVQPTQVADAELVQELTEVKTLVLLADQESLLSPCLQLVTQELTLMQQ
jgi:hypothetical protein